MSIEVKRENPKTITFDGMRRVLWSEAVLGVTGFCHCQTTTPNGNELITEIGNGQIFIPVYLNPEYYSPESKRILRLKDNLDVFKDEIFPLECLGLPTGDKGNFYYEIWNTLAQSFIGINLIRRDGVMASRSPDKGEGVHSYKILKNVEARETADLFMEDNSGWEIVPLARKGRWRCRSEFLA